MSGLTLRLATADDIPHIAELWTEAYAHDPFFRWIQPDDQQWPDFGRDWMTFIAERGSELGHTYLSHDGDVAVCWVQPMHGLVEPDDIMRGRQILESHAGEARSEEVFDIFMDLRSFVPTDPHWALQYIGVRPGRQGQGLGSDAVIPMLEHCDAHGLGSRLAAKNPRNVPFFERFGYTVRDQIATPDGAVTVHFMYRVPRPAA